MAWNECDRAARPPKGAAKAWLAEHDVVAEPVGPACAYCAGYCVHDVAGAEEAGLKFVYSQIVEYGIPMRFDILGEPSHWTRFEPETRQPRELPVYTIGASGEKVFRSGPDGGRSRWTERRATGRLAAQPSKRSQAGALLSALKRMEA